ncbi:hypothetical protein Lal_00031250, partial [Lupinus albus]
MTLDAAVGKPVKKFQQVDRNTLDVKMGRFGRVYVKVDINKLVIRKVWLKGFWYDVEYEGLHRICTIYCCYGHLAKECKKTLGQPAMTSTRTPPPSKETPLSTPLIIKKPLSRNVELNEEKNWADILGGHYEISINEHQEHLVGDWVMVKKKPCKTSNHSKLKVLNGFKGK